MTRTRSPSSRSGAASTRARSGPYAMAASRQPGLVVGFGHQRAGSLAAAVASFAAAGGATPG